MKSFGEKVKMYVDRQKEQIAGNLKVSINEYKRSENEKDVIFYVISVTKRDGQVVKIDKRFSEFVELNKKLKKLVDQLPQLPNKGFGKLKEESQINKRKEELDQFIQDLLCRKDIFNSEVMRKFLQIENYAPETQIEPPRLIKQYKNFVMGIRDFIELKQKNLFFALLGDMKVSSRVDSYLTNMKMPWEKENQGVVMSVGQLQLCGIQEEQEKSVEPKRDRLWTMPFGSQAICMFLEEKSSVVAVGLDEGKVQVVQLVAESNFMKYEVLLDYKVHQARVMGVAYDNITNYLYSVSEDKYLKVTKLLTKEIIANYQVGTHPLTNLHFDVYYKRLFITNKHGQIFIYDASSLPVNQLNILNMGRQSVIRGLHFDSNKNFIIASGYDDGEVCMFEIEKPGKEKFAKKIATFQAKKKVKCITWSSYRGEIYLGDDEGIITIFNAKIGQSIFALKAHESAVTKLQWDEQENVIISAGKDKCVFYWKLPEHWRCQKLEAEEETEFQIQKEKRKLHEFKLIQEKAKYDSEEDDLQNWHKF